MDTYVTFIDSASSNPIVSVETVRFAVYDEALYYAKQAVCLGVRYWGSIAFVAMLTNEAKPSVVVVPTSSTTASVSEIPVVS